MSLTGTVPDVDVILTGLPRSGTTLTCHLLNKLPDTVALHEPMQGIDLGDVSQPRQMSLDVQRFFAEQRRSIRERGMAISRNVNGEVPDNPFGAARSPKGTRRQIDDQGEIRIAKPLSDQFQLVIKHTSRFAPILPALAERFPVYALVRNPLPTLASWTTVEAGIKRGRSGPAGRVDAEMRERVERIPNELDRQIALLDWYFDQFGRSLPAEAIIRYEDLVASGGRALRVIAPAAGQLDEPLESRNLNALYGRDQMLTIGERLLRTDGAFWDFYSRESVDTLLEQVSSSPAS